ncbi:protein-disulfide reductase DsbD domain-containing protein [Fulvimarina sp. MAC8]|uniref:protein-disulfide reductase DsbD domain-containing protein n=1 Tax=Fulvimarina sp. MAC8 TaxID=3162874 RepID=UPI0032EB973B
MKRSFATFARIPLTAAFTALFTMAGTALAVEPAPGNVVENDFATLTLVAEPPAAHGIVRGALKIDLKPGWKTYWLDPGPSGIPPQIDFSRTEGIGKAAVLAPLPQRFGEDLARANGYKHDLALPFLLTPGEGETIDGAIIADVFLGVCEAICVPVQAELSVSPDGAAAVETAFDGLPQTLDASDVTASIDGDALELGLRTNASVSDAFVLGPEGWYFGEAEVSARDDEQTTFRIPIDERPKDAANPVLMAVFDDGDRGLTTVIQPE